MNEMKNYIEKDIISHIKYYFDLVHEDGLDLVVDGVKAFNEKSQFVEGKVVNAGSYYYEHTILNGPDEFLKNRLTSVIDLMSDRKYETWGILNCITALNRLNNKNILNDVVSVEALERFKVKLDWRTFVNTEDLSLISKPTNYYGVAFGIARFRELLGFEAEGWSTKLLDKLLTHIKSYSGEYLFMDETKGDGRFDRYSTLIPAEISSLLLETGLEVPDILKNMLRKSCEIYLNLANDKGHGFSYGRSIGAYGDTAALEILSIGARLGLLSEDEMAIAYNYNTLTIKNMIDFWIDNQMKSINMWDKGRRTDTYRNKNRILGENLSLSMQLINSYEHWKATGYDNLLNMDEYRELLKSLPSFKKFQFSKNDYSRAMFIRRDGNHVTSLPIINGGKKYYNSTPYLPIPNESMVFEAVADAYHNNLMPVLALKNGIKLMPISYIMDVKDEGNSDTETYSVNYRLEKLCKIDSNEPQQFSGIQAYVKYTFIEGSIKYNIEFVCSEIKPFDIEEINMEFATFSSEPEEIDNKLIFKEGNIQEIEVNGFENCNIEKIIENSEYNTPHGSLKYVIKWQSTSVLKPLKLGWEIKYN